jgi:hypothetical protein
VLDLNPVIDSYDPRWLTSVYAWAKSPSGAAYFQNAGSLVMDYKDEPCVRPKASISPLSVNINIHDGQQFSLEQQTFEISYKTTNAPQKIIVTLDGQSIQEIPIAQS